jgi:hypothetical protein
MHEKQNIIMDGFSEGESQGSGKQQDGTKVATSQTTL